MNGYFNSSQEVPFYISRAKIVSMLDSPAKYFAYYGEGHKKPPTQAMKDGVMLHEAVLRPDEFENACKVHSFDSFRTKAAQGWRDQELERNPGSFIMSQEQKEDVNKIVSAVHSDSLVREILNKSAKERFGYAEEKGLVLHSRPDVVTTDGIIAELKFVQSVDENKFNGQQFFEDWYIQLGFYNHVQGLISGAHRSQNAFYIAVEKEYPHRVRVYTLSQKYEEMAMRKIEKGIELIKYFMDKDPEFKNRKLWFDFENHVTELEPKYGYLSSDNDFADLIQL